MLSTCCSKTAAGSSAATCSSVYVLYETEEGDFDNPPREFMCVLEPTVAAHLRIFRWGGVGAGWRQPVFYLRAKIFLGDFIKVGKNRELLFTQEGLQVD